MPHLRASVALDPGGHIEMCVNNENKGYFDKSGKLFDGLFFIQLLITMIERYVNFHFQKLSIIIVHVFDILFHFPGG